MVYSSKTGRRGKPLEESIKSIEKNIWDNYLKKNNCLYLTLLLWSRFALPIFNRILQTLLISTPKTIHNIELKLDIISKINLRNGDSYDEYSKFIIREVLRLREKGYTYPEIVSNFKDRGIRSRRNKEYYKNLLVNMMYKYRKKKSRESNEIYTIKNIRIDVNKVNKDKKYFRF